MDRLQSQALKEIKWRESERRLPKPEGVQGTFGELLKVVPADVPDPKTSQIATHERVHKSKNGNSNVIDSGDESTQFFDDAQVPVEVIGLANPDATGLDPANIEVLSEKVSYRVAQRPRSYLIPKYVSTVIKVSAIQALS